MKVGILGAAGGIGKVHYEQASQIHGIDIIAVADKSKALDSLYGSPRKFSSYEDLLKEVGSKLDAVIIALPNTMHREAVEKSLEYGVSGILLEKPMAVNLDEAKEIVSAVEDSKAKLMICHTGRYHPEFVKAYELVHREKAIGRITSMIELLHDGSKNFPLQYLDKSWAGRGLVLSNGIHSLDRFIWFGEEVPEITHGTYSNNFFNSELEDSADMDLLFKNNKITGSISLRFMKFQPCVNAGCDYKFMVFGERGMIKVDGFYSCTLSNEDGVKKEVFQEKDQPTGIGLARGIKLELEDFFGYVSGENEPRVTIEDALNAQKLVDEFYQKAVNV